MEKQIKILLLEDSQTDAELEERELRKSGLIFTAKRVETKDDFLQALSDFQPDVILSDNSLPSFDGLSALEFVRKQFPDMPFIFVSGTIGEEKAIESLRNGATDYVLKTNLKKLMPAVQRALNEVKEHIEHKKAEQALEQSETKYRNLVEHALSGVYQTNLKGEILYANDAFVRMLEFNSLEEFAKQGAAAKYKDPAERQRFIGILKRDGFVSNFETEIVSKTGQTKNVIVSAKLEGDTITGMVLDITARKQAEEALTVSETRYRRLFEAAKDGIIILDAQTGQIVDVNKFLINLLGFSHDQFMGKKIWEIGFLKDIVPNRENFKELQRKGYIRYENMPLETAGGKMIDVEFVSNIYEVGDKKVIQCNIRDITERKKMEAQLFRAQKLESIGTLAGGVAHDFNNVLTSIKGYAEMLLQEMDASNPIYESISHINQAVDRGSNLTYQLLLFSRRDVTEIKTVELNELIENLLKMLGRLIGEHIKIETKLSPDIAFILADPGNIEQVIMNLVINARDAMPRGGKITLKTENTSIDEKYCQMNLEGRRGEFVCLSVTDTGIGMTEDVKTRIFEPFFTTKEAGKGTGLGLSVVYGIVKKHQGWVNIYSEPGQGAVFRIYLPAQAPAQAGLPKPDTKIIPPAELKGHGERILLVEDDKGVQKVALTTLTKMGYNVLAASTGNEAIELFNAEKGNFHLLLSDVVLPDGNGIDLVAELRLLKPDLKVLMTSGYPSKQSYQEQIKERQLPFIAKPYKLNNLFAKIKELLGKD